MLSLEREVVVALVVDWSGVPVMVVDAAVMVADLTEFPLLTSLIVIVMSVT